jgi:carbon-monoxide dehydrogenase small subunit
MARDGEPRGHLVPLVCSVNGRPVDTLVASHRFLLDFLRDDLALTGTKRACDVQVCGACTVLVDGLPVSACTFMAFEANGRAVETCEGLARGGHPHPIQQAFVDAGALQCGYCTPGMVMTARALLSELPNPTEAEIKEYLHGNICRCTGYRKIIDAIQMAAQMMGSAAADRGAER